MDKNVKAIIRGHLFSINVKPTKTERVDAELYKTKYWDIIVSKTDVVFNKGKHKLKFNYNKLNHFFLKDAEIFVFKIIGNEKSFYFKAIN